MCQLNVLQKYIANVRDAWDSSELEAMFSAYTNAVMSGSQSMASPTVCAAIALLCSGEFARSSNATDLVRYILFANLREWRHSDVYIILICAGARTDSYPESLQEEVARWVMNCAEHVGDVWCLDVFLDVAGRAQWPRLARCARLLAMRMNDVGNPLEHSIAQWLEKRQ